MFEVYNHQNVSWRAAYEFSEVYMDSFREDALFMYYWPPHLRMGRNYVEDITDWSALIARARRYGKLVRTFALRSHLALRDGRTHLFLHRFEKGEIADAGALWVLPSYIATPHLSVGYRLKTLFLRAWYKAYEWWLWLGEVNPFEVPRMLVERTQAGEGLGTTLTPERMKYLKSLDRKLLESRDVRYPSSLTYYCWLFAVRERAQGKGVGRKLMTHCLETFKPYQEPSQFDGPAKASLASSPVGRGFYEKMGFRGKVWKSPNVDLVHTYFNLNLT